MTLETLNNLQQTAMLLLSMGEEAAAQVLSHLDRKKVEAIAHQMAQLSSIKQCDADKILDNFFSLYKTQSGISPASRAYLKKTLDIALGGKVSKTLIDEIYGDEIITLIKKLDWLEPKSIAKEIENEHIQIQATMLSLLEPNLSAKIIEFLPPSLHDDLIIRIAKIKELDSQIMLPIQQLIEKCIANAQGCSNIEVEGVRQVADIINNYNGNKDQLMEMVRLNDNVLAEEILDNMYCFEILEKQSPECIQNIFNQIDTETIALSLKAVTEEFKLKIMSSLPSRMGDGIIDQMQNIGAVAMSKVIKSQKEIMVKVKEMNQNGEISLKLYEEQVVE